MIRDADYQDLDRLIEMGERFFEASCYGDVMAFDEASLEETFAMLIESIDGILLISDNGMVGGLIYPYYFNHSHKTAQELFWWAERKGEGLGLLEAFEKEAKEKGAKTVTMLSLESLEPERVGKIYEQRGYRPSEHSYIRSI